MGYVSVFIFILGWRNVNNYTLNAKRSGKVLGECKKRKALVEKQSSELQIRELQMQIGGWKAWLF